MGWDWLDQRFVRPAYAGKYKPVKFCLVPKNKRCLPSTGLKKTKSPVLVNGIFIIFTLSSIRTQYHQPNVAITPTPNVSGHWSKGAGDLPVSEQAEDAPCPSES